MIPILFLAADPTDESRLRLGEELREIQEKLQLAKLRDRFVLHQRMSIRPADLSQALLDTTPELVHFSGHGTAKGALCIENKLGQMHPIQADTLAALFEQFISQVKCVILNACYSDMQAKAISRHIDYVIGMNKAIGDRAAIAFTVGFYQALGAGRSIEESYRLGCVQIRLENIPEHLTPVLLKKTKNNDFNLTNTSTDEAIRAACNDFQVIDKNLKKSIVQESLIIPSSSIPLLPKSIAVGLQDSLIQYGIELKFLLLFFEKPLAILSNTGFNFISEETVESVKKGKKARTNAFENTDVIQHLELLATEEWEELMNSCEPLYRESILVDTPPEGEQILQVDEIFTTSGLGDFSSIQLFEIFNNHSQLNLDDDMKQMIFGAYVARIEMLRLLDVLQLCQERKIPMVWGCDVDIITANTYTEFLVRKHFCAEESESIRAVMRVLKGEELLKEIFDLQIVNLATVPVSKIVDFRRTNTDLLESFLTKYRGFLVEIQNDPLKADQIARSYTQEILMEMNILKNELLLLRRNNQYQWLDRISAETYNRARAGATAAIWSLLVSPLMLAGELGEVLIKAANKMTGALSEKEKEEALLFRSSSGYLWKAHEEL